MDIRIDEQLWKCSLLPEGALERWRREDGELVAAGAPLAEVRIEDSLHELLAPCAGRLHILVGINTVLAPGDTIGCVVPA